MRDCAAVARRVPWPSVPMARLASSPALLVLVSMVSRAASHGALVFPPARNAFDRTLPQFANGSACNADAAAAGNRGAMNGQPCVSATNPSPPLPFAAGSEVLGPLIQLVVRLPLQFWFSQGCFSECSHGRRRHRAVLSTLPPRCPLCPLSLTRPPARPPAAALITQLAVRSARAPTGSQRACRTSATSRTPVCSTRGRPAAPRSRPCPSGCECHAHRSGRGVLASSRLSAAGSGAGTGLCGGRALRPLAVLARRWTMDRGVAEDSTDDVYRYHPWRAPGSAPVEDACGVRPLL